LATETQRHRADFKIQILFSVTLYYSCSTTWIGEKVSCGCSAKLFQGDTASTAKASVFLREAQGFLKSAERDFKSGEAALRLRGFF